MATTTSTSSVLAAQAPLLMVHRKVLVPPMVRPVTAEVYDPTVVTVAVPAITLQVPLPVTGRLPSNIVVLTLHKLWSLLAADTVGKSATLITTSSVLLAHEPLLMLQRRVTLLPMLKPVSAVVYELIDVIVAAPLITLQVPTPVVARLPSSVVVVTLHKF